MLQLILLGEHLRLRLPTWAHKISHSYPCVWKMQIICDPTRFCELARILGHPPPKRGRIKSVAHILSWGLGTPH